MAISLWSFTSLPSEPHVSKKSGRLAASRLGWWLFGSAKRESIKRG